MCVLTWSKVSLGQWVSTFLILWPFNTVPQLVWSPTIKLLCLLLQNCNLATIMNDDGNICVFLILLGHPCVKLISPQRIATHRLRFIASEHVFPGPVPMARVSKNRYITRCLLSILHNVSPNCVPTVSSDWVRLTCIMVSMRNAISLWL